MFRIYEIHAAIQAGGYPNCTELGRRLRVTRKTIQRDITFMRDELRLPVVYRDDLHGFCYEMDVSDFPVFQTTAEELAGLFLARVALESVRGTQLAEVMRTVFARLTRGIEGRIQLSWADLDQAFSRKAVEASSRDVKLFGNLAQSILDQREVTFFYRKLGADSAAQRRVQPLHLGEVDGGWYLIANDLHRDALRTFALPRISRFRATSTGFARPADFEGARYLKQSFGIWSVAGDETRHLVRVELRHYAARLCQERRWHPTQEVIPLNTKATRVEIRFEVGRLEEVLRWVLSFGSHAKVLSPAPLVDLVRREIRAMAEG
jgi:predicted DNA-binding transcriptional regulator YafY